MTTRFYRQSVPGLGLSIECATDSVPDDGKYHVIRNGQTLGSFRALKPAQQLFRQATLRTILSEFPRNDSCRLTYQKNGLTILSEHLPMQVAVSPEEIEC